MVDAFKLLSSRQAKKQLLSSFQKDIKARVGLQCEKPYQL